MASPLKTWRSGQNSRGAGCRSGCEGMFVSLFVPSSLSTSSADPPKLEVGELGFGFPHGSVPDLVVEAAFFRR